MEIRSILCGYKLCYEWHCTLNDGGHCQKYNLPEDQVVRRFIYAMKVNPNFRQHVMKLYPEVYKKYYNGVQYG